MGLDKLSYEVIDGKPRDYDFSEGYGEKWEVAIDMSDQERDEGRYDPMMNYIYPLGRRFDVPLGAADLLNNTTIVHLLSDADSDTDFEYSLALTGGGMDFSWELCESYINLGFYPPAHFCQLPRMAGRGTSRGDRHIIACCMKSLQAMRDRNGYGVQKLRKDFPSPKKSKKGAA